MTQHFISARRRQKQTYKTELTSAARSLNVSSTFPDINPVKSGFCVAQEGEDAGKLFPALRLPGSLKTLISGKRTPTRSDGVSHTL